MKITITKNEGKSELCGIEHVFDNFFDAKCFLANSEDLPKNGGYYKHSFMVDFGNDDTYEGRLDVKHRTCENADNDIYEHCTETLLFYLGRYCPSHMDKATYHQHLMSHTSKEDNAENEALLALFEEQAEKEIH